MQSWEKIKAKMRYFWDVHVPSVIWRRDECEVLIAFDLSKVPLEHVLRVEKALSAIGVHFDRGASCGERHWEWDYSLSGPVMVRYKRRGKRD